MASSMAITRNQLNTISNLHNSTESDIDDAYNSTDDVNSDKTSSTKNSDEVSKLWYNRLGHVRPVKTVKALANNGNYSR